MNAHASAVSSLFRPAAIGKLDLANRVVMSPMTRSFSPGGVPGADVAAYYRRRAEGGIGLIVTEGVAIEHETSLDDQDVPAIYGADALRGWRKVIEEVHAAGGKIVPQLWHQGCLRNPAIAARPDLRGSRPSGVWGTPGVVSYTKEYVESLIAPTEPMTETEIADVIAAFVRGAVAAKEVGFDGVALHGAHGYLIDSFFWHDTNRRDDRYGGSIKNRVRFGEEIVKATRAAVGPAFPIMFRYSQHKQQDYKARLASSPEELEMFLGPLADAGVDLFDASARRFYERAFATSPLTLAGWTKKLTGIPSVAVGSAGLTAEGTPEHMAAFLDREEFDFIAIGRAVLHDPNWARKVQVGETPDAFDPSSLDVLT